VFYPAILVACCYFGRDPASVLIHTQRFLSIHSRIHNDFQLSRHHLSSNQHRAVRDAVPVHVYSPITANGFAIGWRATACRKPRSRSICLSSATRPRWRRRWHGIGRAVKRQPIGPTKVPTLFIWGDADDTVGRISAEGTVEFIAADYRFAALPGVGHYAADQVPEQVNALLLEHIARHHT
jgi:pimeloyl-ACP methyl ester carboxylesterase